MHSPIAKFYERMFVHKILKVNSKRDAIDSKAACSCSVNARIGVGWRSTAGAEVARAHRRPAGIAQLHLLIVRDANLTSAASSVQDLNHNVYAVFAGCIEGAALARQYFVRPLWHVLCNTAFASQALWLDLLGEAR